MSEQKAYAESMNHISLNPSFDGKRDPMKKVGIRSFILLIIMFFIIIFFHTLSHILFLYSYIIDIFFG